MDFKLVLLALAIASVECVDRQRLGKTPSPQKHFMDHKYVGNWYIQARLAPCSWAGSYKFTNFVSQYSLKTSGDGIYVKDTWRSTDCTSATLQFEPKGHPGVYVLKDPIGGFVSGINVIVATDYKTFVIKWGCTKSDTDGSCSDPYVIVKTRKRDPSPHTWKGIEAILDHYWSLGLSEMKRIVHDQDACVELKEPHHDYVSRAERLHKTY